MQGDNGQCYWWLRTWCGGNGHRNAAIVNLNGLVDSYGAHADDNDVSVRPALWINLKS